MAPSLDSCSRAGCHRRLAHLDQRTDDFEVAVVIQSQQGTGIVYSPPPPWIPWLSVTGSGTLVAVSIANANCAHYLRIVIDGIPLTGTPWRDLPFCLSTGQRTHNSLTINAPFQQSLEISFASVGGPDHAVYWAVYDV